MEPLLDLSCLSPQADTLCFTGHRPKNIYSRLAYSEMRREDYQGIVLRIRKEVRSAYEEGFRNFLSGGAQGFDQLAFWAVHGLKKEYPDIRNRLVLPFEGQDSVWSREGLFSQAEYRQMKRHADSILICAKTDKSASSARKALLYRNQVMVALSSLVIGMTKDASWKEESSHGGTAHCLRLAKEGGRKIVTKSFLQEEETNG